MTHRSFFNQGRASHFIVIHRSLSLLPRRPRSHYEQSYSRLSSGRELIQRENGHRHDNTLRWRGGGSLRVNDCCIAYWAVNPKRFLIISFSYDTSLLAFKKSSWFPPLPPFYIYVQLYVNHIMEHGCWKKWINDLPNITHRGRQYTSFLEIYKERRVVSRSTYRCGTNIWKSYF